MSAGSVFPIATTPIDELEFDLPTVVESYLDQAVARPEPYLIHMLGVPGAGKSMVANLLAETLAAQQRPPVFVAFDQIMCAMQGYKDTRDIVEAFAKFELPARAAGYTLISRLLPRCCDVLLDHGGSASEHPDILRFASKQYGHRTIVVHVTVDSDRAKERIIARAKKEGRHTPLEYVDTRKREIDALIPEYRAAADAYFTVDNSEDGRFEAVQKRVDEIVVAMLDRAPDCLSP